MLIRPRSGSVSLAAGLLALISGLAIPARGEEPAVVTAIAGVRQEAMTSGGAGILGYEVSHRFNRQVVPPVSLPGTVVPRNEHPQAFEGVFADYAMLGAWMAPRDMIQFAPASSLYENAYFTNTMLDKDAFGDTVGVPLGAGDRFDLGIANIPYDNTLPWNRERQPTATGHLEWDAATDVRHLTSHMNGADGEVDVILFRADLVARGGDVDGRSDAVQSPPLVFDLPRTYSAQAIGGYSYSIQYPNTHYIGDTELRVLPGAGKAVLVSDAIGYLPEAREYLGPTGAELKEWHITITGLISVSAGSDPALAPRLAITPSGPGRVVVGLGDRSRELELGAGDTLATGPGLDLGTVLPAESVAGGEPEAAPAAGAVSGSNASVAEEMKRASGVTAATLTEPLDLSLGRGQYRLTLDPDFRGLGVLGLSEVRRGSSGTRFANAAAVPYIRIDGEPVLLNSERLLDLRILPMYRWVGIQQTGWGSTTEDPLSFARTSRTAAHKPGLLIDAVYDLGAGRYAFVTFSGEAENRPQPLSVAARVRTLNGAPVAASPVHYLEVPGVGGSVSYLGEDHTTEFSAPLDALGDNKEIRLGDRTFAASILTAGREGVLTVTRGGGVPSPVPLPDASHSLGDGPLGISYTVPNDIESKFAFTSTRLTLDRDGEVPAPAPKPLGTACGIPQIVDGSTPDAPPSLDVRSAWLDADDANLYVTIRLAEVPTAAPMGQLLSYAFHFRTEHSAFYARAAVDSGGHWTFGDGWYNVDYVVPTYSDVQTVTGEVRSGPDGVIRIAVPRTFPEGELLRDTSVHANVTTAQGLTYGVDAAPQGSGRTYGTGGDYLVGAPCA